MCVCGWVGVWGVGGGCTSWASMPQVWLMEFMLVRKPSVMARRILAVPMPERCFASASASARFTASTCAPRGGGGWNHPGGATREPISRRLG